MTFCLPLFLGTRRKEADSERNDFPARGAQKNGHPQEAASVGVPLCPRLGPETASGLGCHHTCEPGQPILLFSTINQTFALSSGPKFM